MVLGLIRDVTKTRNGLENGLANGLEVEISNLSVFRIYFC